MRTARNTCERIIYWRYVAGIRKRIDDKPALAIGSSFHLGIETWRNGSTPFVARDAAIDLLTGKLEEMGTDEKSINIEQTRLNAYLCGYFLRYPQDVMRKLTESEVKIDLPNEIGFVDNFYIDESGKVWIVEDKTTGIRPQYENTLAMLSMDEQLLSYACLLQDYGYQEIAGCFYRQVVKCRLKPKRGENLVLFNKRVKEKYTHNSSEVDSVHLNDNYFEYKIVFKQSDIENFRSERNLNNDRCRVIMETVRDPSNCTRNSSACIGKYGPCEYLELCSKGLENVNNSYIATGKNSLDGGLVRSKLNIKESTNDKTTTRLHTPDPDAACELSDSTVQKPSDVAVWPAGNGED